MKIISTLFSAEVAKRSTDGNQLPEAVYQTYFRQHQISEISLS
jgi:hypothetical protein